MGQILRPQEYVCDVDGRRPPVDVPTHNAHTKITTTELHSEAQPPPAAAKRIGISPPPPAPAPNCCIIDEQRADESGKIKQCGRRDDVPPPVCVDVGLRDPVYAWVGAMPMHTDADRDACDHRNASRITDSRAAGWGGWGGHHRVAWGCVHRLVYAGAERWNSPCHASRIHAETQAKRERENERTRCVGGGGGGGVPPQPPQRDVGFGIQTKRAHALPGISRRFGGGVMISNVLVRKILCRIDKTCASLVYKPIFGVV